MSDKCASDLESVLYGKVAGYVSNLDEALIQYQEECAERSRIVNMSSRREDLERQLAAKWGPIPRPRKSPGNGRTKQPPKCAALRTCVTLRRKTMMISLGNCMNSSMSASDGQKLMEKELGQHIFVRSAWKKRQAEATKQLQSKGLAPDAAAIRSLAEELDRAHLVKSTYDNWNDVRQAER